MGESSRSWCAAPASRGSANASVEKCHTVEGMGSTASSSCRSSIRMVDVHAIEGADHEHYRSVEIACQRHQRKANIAAPSTTSAEAISTATLAGDERIPTLTWTTTGTASASNPAREAITLGGGPGTSASKLARTRSLVADLRMAARPASASSAPTVSPRNQGLRVMASPALSVSVAAPTSVVASRSVRLVKLPTPGRVCSWFAPRHCFEVAREAGEFLLSSRQFTRHVGKREPSSQRDQSADD